MFATVSDIITKERNARVYAYDNNGLSYIITIDGNRKKAYKVTNTTNKGVVLMSWPISRARVKLINDKLKTMYDNGNIKLLKGTKGPRTVRVV